jgi:hypothetical protein
MISWIAHATKGEVPIRIQEIFFLSTVKRKMLMVSPENLTTTSFKEGLSVQLK